jgi:hypothetical protein
MMAAVSDTDSTLVARNKLSSEARSAMFELLRTHFDGVDEAQFAADLGEKNWVMLLRRGERIVGFTTFAVYESCFRGETLTVVYSGDTIVAPEAWNSSALSRGWIAAVKVFRERAAHQRCVWLLLTSGFRTYRFLPVFWREFYPNFEFPAQTPALLAHLARERFGAQYLADDGVVRFSKPQRLAGDLNRVPDGRRRDPHVEFFLRRNPGWANGDELVCLTELYDENLTPAGRRMTRSRNEFAVRND